MQTTLIAMWSGPRNLSSACMRSFSSRSDTVVIDEPLYSPYLHLTGIYHPGRDEVLQTYPTDWRQAVRRVLEPPMQGRAVCYQKHMTHHLLPEMDRSWVTKLRNAFLIRSPRDVLTSYARVIREPTLEDLGLPQQVEIFELVREETGAVPPVVDAADLLRDPEAMLRALCERLEIPFEPAMLSWDPGPHVSDGVWAKFWYGRLWTSTGFAPYAPKTDPLPEKLEPLLERCQPFYDALHPHRIRVGAEA